MTTIKAPAIHRIIIGQTLATCILAGVGLLLQGSDAAISLFWGGMVCLVGNAVFAVKAFRYRGASATSEIVRELASGEALKILLSALGFGLAFIALQDVQPLFVFLGYVGVYVVGVGLTVAVVQRYSPTN